MDGENKTKNDMIKMALVNEYKSFVDSVDPSEIVDILIEKRVMTTEEWTILDSKKIRKDKNRFLLDKLFTTSNPESFIVLNDALSENYPWIHEQICAKVKSLEKNELNLTKLDVGELMHRLENSETKQVELVNILEDKENKIKQMELENTLSKNKEINGCSNRELSVVHHKNEELEATVSRLQAELKEMSEEISCMNSHVMILEGQIKGSASCRKSQGNIMDFDYEICNSLQEDPSEKGPGLHKEGGVRIINPIEIIRRIKLPRYCGSYYDLYNGRYGKECSPISIKELIKDTKEAKEDKFRKEAELTCQLNHSRLTKLLGQTGDSPVSFLLYESSYMLNALNFLKMTPSIVNDCLRARWCVQLACAIEHLHSHGILMRNICLTNVLVVGEGKSVKLTNFDYAVKIPKDCNCYVDADIPTDKMEKLAPETWMQKCWYEATDVWSFALTTVKIYCHALKMFPSQTERDIKTLMETRESLLDVIVCARSIANNLLMQTLKTCLYTDHTTRPTIKQLTLFNAYNDDAVTACENVRERMVDRLIDHVIENKRQVKSITTLNNHLYFLVNSSSSIKCYHMSKGYKKLASIKLGLSRKATLQHFFQTRKQKEVLKEDCMTASQKLLSICAADECLFVLDGARCGVWKVEATKNKRMAAKRKITFFKMPALAVFLQCSSNQQSIIVFCKQPCIHGYSAVEYFLDGSRKRKFLCGLPLEPLHQGVYVDSFHTMVMTAHKEQDTSAFQLRVVDNDGSASSGYGTLLLQKVSDFCIHRPLNSILIADLSTNSVLLVDSCLNSQPVHLFGIEQGINGPSALHIDSEGSIFVGLISGNVICFHYEHSHTNSVAS